MRAAEENTIAHHCWEEVEKQSRQNKSKFWILKQALSTIKLEKAWHTPMPYSAFKQITNKAIKQLLLQTDKDLLANKRHAWMVRPTYKQLKLQSYWQECFTDHKWKLTLLRLGFFPTKDLTPKWLGTWLTTDCCLCGNRAESLLHLLCICPALHNTRKILLQPILREEQIRTCRAVVITFLSGSSVQLSCKTKKFLNLAAKELEKKDLAIKQLEKKDRWPVFHHAVGLSPAQNF